MVLLVWARDDETRRPAVAHGTSVERKRAPGEGAPISARTREHRLVPVSVVHMTLKWFEVEEKMSEPVPKQRWRGRSPIQSALDVARS